MIAGQEVLNRCDFNKFDQLKVKVTDADYVEMVRNQIIDRGFLVSSLSQIQVLDSEKSMETRLPSRIDCILEEIWDFNLATLR